MRKAAPIIGFILLFMLIFIPVQASAAAIFEHQNTVVPAGQTVDDVYVVGGDAEIQGHVTGIVVVINGDLHAASTAIVEGMVVVIGGKVDQSPGAEFGDDVFDLSLDGPTQNSLLIGGGLIVGLWVIQLGGSILLVLIPTLISLIGKRKTQAFIDRFSPTSWSRLLYIGFLSGVVVTAVSVLLFITIVGIPVLILILVILILILFAGLTVIGHRIGEQFRGAAYKPDWLKVMIGTMLITAVINFPFLGWIALLSLVLISLGICVEWMFSKRKRS
ncbi:hypothetical protein [Paenibacillus kobensis]|uniref:hypothetical protein n=1 Tax=Paenibacillus kobensis TaxID=59841 RepID=UPI000FDC275E|nr:hypothetical protein [Paenibacillus kobensis]